MLSGASVVDLPARGAGSRQASAASARVARDEGIDLPATLAVDLPIVAGAAPGALRSFDDLPEIADNLPTIGPIGGASTTTGVPGGVLFDDLPIVSADTGVADLPSLSTEADLPTLSDPNDMGGSLPVVATGGGFGDIDLPAAPPQFAGFGQDDGFAPMSVRNLPLPKIEPGASSFDFDALPASIGAPAGAQGRGAPGATEVPAKGDPNAGGASWGERALTEGTPLADDDMEFGAIPQERPGAEPAVEAAAEAGVAKPDDRRRPIIETSSEGTETSSRREVSRRLKVGALVAVLVLSVGGGLGLTPLGVFGTYAILDAVHAKGYETARVEALSMARQSFARDTSQAASQAIEQIDQAQRRAPRAKGLAAAAALVSYQKELRFGRDPAVHAHAATLMTAAGQDTKSETLSLALAAQAATSDQLARGQSLVDAVLARAPDDPDAVAVAGEIALLGKDAAQGLAHFTKLAQIEASPRAHFGLARTHAIKESWEQVEANAKKVLELEPTHAGARLVLARVAWRRQDEQVATAQLEAVLKRPAVMAAASQNELVGAHTLTGLIHLKRSRVGAAEAAFKEALKLEPSAPGALSGVGEALYRAGRYSEALARFGSAMETDPEALEPKVGVAKTKLALERLQEAKELLKNLHKKKKDENKPSALVLGWLGKAEETLGDKAAAEADYNEAIKLAGTEPDVVDIYVWLAQLLNGLGRPAEAQAKLDEAKAKLPKSVALLKALGDFAFQSGHYPEAEQNLAAALELDGQDISTRFRLGSTLRRLKKFDESAAAFDKVGEADKDFPGLSLERAVLAEASGNTARAIELFESALAKAPNDPDLQLRVAAALLAGAQQDQLTKAETLLRKVMAVRQNSAEANHFLGRALLARGTNLAEAKRYLNRAVDLDGNRAEYHLYLGWAANEADQQQVAGSELDRAIELDRSLADAYWQRGVLRRRQRGLAQAEADLLKALELRPSLYEAHATLAEVFEDQQKWPQALSHWQKAIGADAKRADWRYRVGKLMWQQSNQAGALENLSQAVSLASQLTTPPGWLSDACFLLAECERTAGRRADAIEHFQRFLSIAPLDSPYRIDAEKALKQLGVR